MKKNLYLALLCMTAAVLFFISCSVKINPGGGVELEWAFEVTITGDGFGGSATGDTDVQISQDLNHVWGTSTFPAPQYGSSRFPPALVKAVVKYRLGEAMRRAIPGLQTVGLIRDGIQIPEENVINLEFVELEGQIPNVMMDFDITFAEGETVAYAISNEIVSDSASGRETLTSIVKVTRNKSEETPNRVEFNAELVDEPGYIYFECAYSVVCTR